MATREEVEYIDVADPIREICERLGLTYNLVASLDMRPGDFIATVYVPNEHGSAHVDLETGDVVMETLTFKVRT